MSNSDVEKQASDGLEWHNVSYSVKEKQILKTLSGSARRGELVAVLGPSGAGKSTFLDLLGSRKPPSTGTISLHGRDITGLPIGSLAYVEQHDALLGVLTVKESIAYSARLSHPKASKTDISEMVDSTLRLLGLSSVSGQRIGTPITRGISGGQKRRVTIGCALVSTPQALLLDEPTSGLDSSSAIEVVKALRNIARSSCIPIICTIHQPNWDCFSLFDTVLIFAKGHTAYFGPTRGLPSYMTAHMGLSIKEHANPADKIIESLNNDFENSSEAEKANGNGAGEEGRKLTPEEYGAIWEKNKRAVSKDTVELGTLGRLPAIDKSRTRTGSAVTKAIVLTERNFLNYSRNLLGYGVRLGMYIGMGVLLATVWVNLGNNADKVNDRLSVHFFSVAFLGFMSVAGIPTFLEERDVFIRERLNGLYTPLPYVIANSLVTIPFLGACALLFSVICYWSIGLHGGASHFFKFFIELFLAVYVAESQSVLIAAIIPIFVAALALAAFLNGFWMCVQGYFIRAVNLPRFWYWWAHWIDYQTYAFNFLVNNDFRGLTFPCQQLAGQCNCPYPSSLSAAQCALKGEDVLKALQIDGISLGLYAGLLVVITLVYRVLLWVTLVIRKH